MNKVIPVDCGKKGGYAIINNNQIQDIELHNLDHIGEFISHMKELRSQVEFGHTLTAVVEHPPAFCGNFSVPSSAGFKLGESFGQVCGVLRALDIPLILIRPKEWQSGLSGLKGLSGAPRKRLLADHARRLMPKAKLTLRNADAALLGWYYLNKKKSKSS